MKGATSETEDSNDGDLSENEDEEESQETESDPSCEENPSENEDESDQKSEKSRKPSKKRDHHSALSYKEEPRRAKSHKSHRRRDPTADSQAT